MPDFEGPRVCSCFPAATSGTSRLVQFPIWWNTRPTSPRASCTARVLEKGTLSRARSRLGAGLMREGVHGQRSFVRRNRHPRVRLDSVSGNDGQTSWAEDPSTMGNDGLWRRDRGGRHLRAHSWIRPRSGQNRGDRHPRCCPRRRDDLRIRLITERIGGAPFSSPNADPNAFEIKYAQTTKATARMAKAIDPSLSSSSGPAHFTSRRPREGEPDTDAEATRT